MAMIVALASIIGLGASAQAQTLSLSASDSEVIPGESVDILFNVDDATGLAGAALTIAYDGNEFGADETNEAGEDFFIATSPVFVLVTDSRQPPGTPEQAIPSMGNMDSKPDKVLLSGAYVDPTDGGGAYSGPQTLFSVGFAPDMDATPGFYTFTGMNSEICNLDAGWGNDDGDGVCEPGEEETVPALVGAVDKNDAAWGGEDLSDDFPILVNEFTPVTVTVKIAEYGDYVDDIDDDWEWEHVGSLIAMDNGTDTDQDGYWDVYEGPDYNNTDPNEQDDAWVLPNYNPETDNRGPYQIVMSDPESPTANPGESFSMIVDYDTTDDNQNTNGLSLRIHYDSTKLTWAGFADVLATPISQDVTPTQDDGDLDGDSSTDKYLLVEWADAGSEWPGVDLPAALYTVTFTATAGLTEGESTYINFSSGSTAGGYTFHGDSAEVRTCTPGDITGDGEITAQDAVDCFWLSLETSWTPAELCACDFNEDDEVTAGDANLIFWESLK
jgi:hypothetical protein